MHELQERILQLAQRMDISGLPLRQIGKLIEEDHPQRVKHHLTQLVKNGLLQTNSRTGAFTLGTGGEIKKINLFALPIVGSANCGPATILAQDNIEGYLRVSPNVLHHKRLDQLFVVKAVGNSLDRALAIDGGPIEDGDFVVVDYSNRTPNNGDYVLSLIDGSANLKRFYLDEISGRIALVSESSLKIPPIYIHESDFADFLVNGVVVGVIKKPRI